jgi:uncharacterized protein YjiK
MLPQSQAVCAASTTKSSIVIFQINHCMYKRSLIALLFLAAACNGSEDNKKPGKKQAASAVFGNYNLQEYRAVELPPQLNEISGIMYDTATNKLLAVNDEEGILFSVDPANGAITGQTKFAGKGDFEEVFWGSNCFWVLESSGTLMRYAVRGRTIAASQSVRINLAESEEYEAAWLLRDSVRLAAACKRCAGTRPFVAVSDSGRNNLYRFEKNEIDFSGLSAPGNKGGFRASGAAVHPADGHVYLVSSPDKKILRMTQEGKVLEMAHLDAEQLRQPESLCFLPDGSLCIASEADGGKARILFFKPKQQ